jgi:hypothetical protein
MLNEEFKFDVFNKFIRQMFKILGQCKENGQMDIEKGIKIKME